MSKKIKQKKNKREENNQKLCSNCFKSQHIVFSFAYLSYTKDMTDKDIQAIWKRFRELSNIPYMELRDWDKVKGFEKVPLKISKMIPIKFEEEIQKFDGLYNVMRIYKNNNLTPGRIIGKLVNKVFYMFYIDSKGELYKH